MGKRLNGRLLMACILGLSLIGNAVAIGAVWRLQDLRQELTAGASDDAFFPKDWRRAIRDDLRDNADDLRPKLAALVAARAEVVRRATAEPFDPDALQTAMEGFRAELDTLVSATQSVIFDTVTRRRTE